MSKIWAVFGWENDAAQHIGDNLKKNDAPNIGDITRRKRQSMCIRKYPHLVLLYEGEIYNCKQLETRNGYKYETSFSVEAILHAYETLGADAAVRSLDGVFAICLLDTRKKKLLVARDPYGVKPLFKFHSHSGVLALSSQSLGLVDLAKAMYGTVWKIEPFLPGHYEEYKILKNGSVKLSKEIYYHKPGDRPSFLPREPAGQSATEIYQNVRNLLRCAVEKRLLASREKRIGCLLSGGLDSSLVAALLVKLAKENNIPGKIQTFAFGMGENPDIIAARQVANFLGTDHHEMNFTFEEVAEVLDDVINHPAETCHVANVRSMIALDLTTKYIKQNTETRVVFTGEGADEVAEGYVYFGEAPSPKDAHDEVLRLLKTTYLYDGVKLDRTIGGSSLEFRVPFLDLNFTSYYLSLDPASRLRRDGFEKYILRAAFEGTELLPDNILWRHKEIYKDGIDSTKKSLLQVVQDAVQERVDDDELQMAADSYPYCTPKTKEALYYRKIYESHRRGQGVEVVPFVSIPRWAQEVNLDWPVRFTVRSSLFIQ